VRGAAYNVACRAASMSPAELRRHIAVPPPPPPSKATCRMLTWHQPIYVGGHYLKWARGVPQSPWTADGQTIGDGSVQASLEAVIVKLLRADGAKLNSAGGALRTST